VSPEWQPGSWRGYEAPGEPEYPDPVIRDRVLSELSRLPPLVTSWEVLRLRSQLADAARGSAFVLQGGDCVERFADCTSARIVNTLKVLLQMSLVLVVGAQRPLIRVGRFAGQYAWPQSPDSETRGGVSLPSFRSDIVNRPEFTTEARTPDPELLLRSYERAALTLNFTRALIKGGFADLHHPEYFDLDWVRLSPQCDEYHRVASQITEAISFLENVLGVRAGASDRIDFYTSHEALILAYEQAQTRRVPRRSGYFNLSTHFPWIGSRLNQPNGAQVEYLRGIDNPVGIKVGCGATRECVAGWLQKLDPDRTPGRLTLIHRFGACRIADELPQLIELVRGEGGEVLWICDPMHGNTRTTAHGVRTRRFEDIQSEVGQAFDIHRALGQQLGGVHLEFTGENVAECTGGARGISEKDLPQSCDADADPRLNYEQALELAFHIARKMKAVAL